MVVGCGIGGKGRQRRGFWGAELGLMGSAKGGRRATTQARQGVPGYPMVPQASAAALCPGKLPIGTSEELAGRGYPSVSEGQMTIAQRFNAG